MSKDIYERQTHKERQRTDKSLFKFEYSESVEFVELLIDIIIISAKNAFKSRSLDVKFVVFGRVKDQD
jgi:hypothetical protein